MIKSQEEMQEICYRLFRDICFKRRTTLNRLAKESGVSRYTLKRIMDGKGFNSDTLFKLYPWVVKQAEALGIPVDGNNF